MNEGVIFFYLSYVPVDVPLLHVVVAPGLHHVTHPQVNPDQTVRSNTQDLIFPTALKPRGKNYLLSSFCLICGIISFSFCGKKQKTKTVLNPISL